MPRFKRNEDLLRGTEYFESKFMNIDELPPTIPWNGSKEPHIEDIDIWEILGEQSGPSGIFAPWLPYIDKFLVIKQGKILDFTDEARAERLCKENGIHYPQG